MRKSGSKLLLGVSVGVIFIIILNAFWLHWFRPHTAAGSSWATAIFNESGRLNIVGSAFFHWRDLADENARLKEQLAADTAERASIQQLEKENNQLRSAAGLERETRRDVVPAGVYGVTLSPDGYVALVNKGTVQGVAVGNIVVSEDSVLLGTVQAVFANSSRITLVSDPAFKVTVRVLGGQAKGIARGALGDGMTLDLVVQSDEIQEGDTLVSSGDDMVPGGLVVGTVKHVENNSAKLFKQVTIAPSAQYIIGNAYILK